MRPDSGQILLLGSLLLAGVFLGLFAVTKLSLQSQQQLHTQYVANHAAESLAIMGARDLNFKATTNRAMLANELVIGQLMALQTWFSMAESASERTALFTSWIPYLNGLTEGLSNAIQQVKAPIETGISLALRAQDMFIWGLETAQVTFHQASWVLAFKSLHQIVEQSNPNYRVSLLNHQSLIEVPNLWLSFQQRTASDSYADWVTASRDPFTKERSYNWLSFFIVDVEKAGGTEISQQGKRLVWQSIDTLGVHIDTLFGRQELRLGWGAAYLNDALPANAQRSEFGGSYRINRRTSRRAADTARELQLRRSTPFQYLLADAEEPFPTVTVVVTESERENERGEQRPRKIGIGRYQVYFSRPHRYFPRADKGNERANLLNGLWTVKANPIKTLDRKVIEAQL